MLSNADDADERRQEALNPHRREDQARAAATIASQLGRRGLRTHGDESGDQLADLLTAVERFEAAVDAAGGDLMLNQPGSTDPENPAFVLPMRRADESPDGYASRIRGAAAALGTA